MPIETNLNVSPYFDDFDEAKAYYKVLFKPGVAVQVREMNQLQTILQNQIERFGDNILKKGTIIDGCNFMFNNAQPYVKIEDNQLDADPAVPNLYVQNFVKNSSNLVAFIVNSADGFQTAAPDLKTLYVNYINSGIDGQTKQFTPGESLTVYDPTQSIRKVIVNTTGSNFSNSDPVIFTPKVAVSVTTGSFSAGDYLIEADAGSVANLQIMDVDTSTLSSLGLTLLTLKPKAADLANASANSSLWTPNLNATVRNQTTAAGTIAAIYGVGAGATIVTNAAGAINFVTVTGLGEGYEFTPTVSVRSLNNLAGINQTSFTAQNYIAQLRVDAAADAVGNGYTFSVKQGIVYQKGYFQRVEPQTVIVSKYDTTPNNVVAGFTTYEEIINSNVDPSLLDNALGTENYTAPGADRLKLTPEVVVIDKDTAAANAEFFTLVEWNEGNPYKQNQLTVYNRIGDEIARGIYDSAGNFVMDQFQVTTASVSTANDEGKYFNIVVDPGQAYIGGQRVQTLSNYQIGVRKGLDTKISNNNISLNYGNFIYVNELGGNFQFNVGAEVELYNLPKQYLSNSAHYTVANTVANGIKIGVAKMRSLIHDRNQPGTSAAVYKLYLFDIQMNGGRNFGDVKAVRFNDATSPGIADVILDNGLAKLNGIKDDGLIFPSGVESLKVSSNTFYTYRSISNTNANTSGKITVTLTGDSKFARATSNLSSAELTDIIVVPTANDLIEATALDGTVNVASSANVVMSTNGTILTSSFEVGDYIYIESGATTNIRRVTSISNGSYMTIDTAPSISNTAANFYRVFPKNVPIPFGYRTGLTANVDVNRTVLKLSLAHTNGTAIAIGGGSSVNTQVAYTARREDATSSTKTVNRNRVVKIAIANNVAGTNGPWCIGVPDAFRLRNVYVAGSTVNTASPNVTDKFYIDHNQNPNFLGLSYLYVKPSSRFKLTNGDYLLVEFDYYSSTSGYFDTKSYIHSSTEANIIATDSKSLAELTNDAASWEVPEVYTYNNQYYDLLNQMDFRPAVANTVAPVLIDSYASAPINPSNTETFNTTVDKYFPYPDSVATTNIEHYLGRVDDVYIGERGDIYVLQGISDIDPRRRYLSNHPKDSLKLQMISVPPYPSLQQTISENVAGVLNTRIANEKNLNLRVKNRTTMPIMSTTSQQISQPMVYTMEDIGNLERRIKDLEYYVSLSVLETNITNKVIPSSTDPNLNRFKYGFFADDFSSTIYSDTDNPQYAAAVEVEGETDYGFIGSPIEPNPASADVSNPVSTTITAPSQIVQKKTNRITPPKFVWGIDHFSDNLTYSNELVISQQNATATANVCLPTTTTTTTTTTVNGYFYTQQSDSGSNKEVKTDIVTFGSIAGKATLYFYNYSAADKIEIFKNGTPIISTAVSNNAVVALTATDKTFLSTNAAAKSWYNLNKTADLNKTFSRGTGSYTDYVANAGKIVFDHNPATGRDYTIKVSKGSGSVIWKYLLEYPSSSNNVNTIVNVSKCTIDPPNPIYQGTLKVRGIKSWSCSNQFRISSQEYTAFVVDVTGLSPKTVHKFYLDGIEQGSNVAPREWGVATTSGAGFKYSQVTLGETLKSDERGRLSFTVYVPIKNLPWVINQLGLTGGIYSDSKTNQVTSGSSGYSTLEVRDTNSFARLVVANRDPNKVLPWDPKANP